MRVHGADGCMVVTRECMGMDGSDTRVHVVGW